MTILLRAAVLALVVALATVVASWWVLPLVGAVFALVSVRRGKADALLVAFKAGLLGWLALVVLAAVQGGAGRVAAMMGGVLGVPPWALFLITPLYGALLMLAGALLGSSVSRPGPESRGA